MLNHIHPCAIKTIAPDTRISSWDRRKKGRSGVSPRRNQVFRGKIAYEIRCFGCQERRIHHRRICIVDGSNLDTNSSSIFDIRAIRRSLGEAGWSLAEPPPPSRLLADAPDRIVLVRVASVSDVTGSLENFHSFPSARFSQSSGCGVRTCASLHQSNNPSSSRRSWDSSFHPANAPNDNTPRLTVSFCTMPATCD